MSDTFVITNNYFGGSAPLATGSWVRDSCPVGNGGFYVAYIRASSSVGIIHRIQGNVIKNVVSQTQKVAGGRGIYGFLFRETNAAPFNIKGNIISDLIYENDASNSATVDRNIVGIRLGGTGAINVSGNEIYSFDNRCVQSVNSGSATAGISWGGIGYSPGGATPLIISNNKIHDIKSTSIVNGGTGGKVPTTVFMTSGIIGVLALPSVTISGNSVYNISNYNSGAYSSSVVGIYVLASSDATLALNNIRNNTVYNISSASTIAAASAPYIIGIGISGGNVNCYNNAVSLGSNDNGHTLVGILKYNSSTASNCNFYHNSVYIGGSATGTAGVSERYSFGFLRIPTLTFTGNDVLKNNIFYSERSGATKHFAVGLSNTANFVSDYNEIYTGTSGNLGTTDVTEIFSAVPTSLNFSAWQAAVAGDASSKNINLLFLNTANGSLGVGSPLIKGAGATGLGITTDIFNNIRPTPPSIGAGEVIYLTSVTVVGQIVGVGSTLQMGAITAPSNASDNSVLWSVSNITGKATISTTTGLLTGVNPGMVTVTATARDGGAVVGEGSVLVGDVVQSILVTSAGGATTINTDGGALQLTANILPTTAFYKDVVWDISSGANLAKITSTGNLYARANGTVTARATAIDGSGVAGTFTVTITNQTSRLVTGINVSGASGDSIALAGGLLQMKADILPLNATNQTVSWSRTNLTGTATLSAAGVLTAVTNGTVRVIATATDGSGVVGQKDIKITNQLPATITVSNAVQTISDAVGQVAKAQASEAVGRIYLVYSTIGQANIFDLEAARKKHKAAFGTISAINTDVLIPTDSLVAGTYNVYATDATHNRSVSSSGNSITITDGIPPVPICPVMLVTNALGNSINIQSSEKGYAYIIKSDVPQASLSDLDAAVVAHNGAIAPVSIAYSDISVGVYNLTPGTYYLYVIDAFGNLSGKGTNAITIADGIPPVVTAVTQSCKNGVVKMVYAQSNESSGKVYIILASLVKAGITITSLDSIVALQQGVSGVVTAANTDMPILTYGAVPGKYMAYAVDGSNNVSAPGISIIYIIDGIPPIASLAKSVTVTNGPGQFVNLRSSETPSRLYLVLDGSTFSTYTDLQSLVLSGNASMALSLVDDSIPVPADGLTPGTYYGYAVDNDDNISDKSNYQIIVSGITGVHNLLDGMLNIYASGNDIMVDVNASILQVSSAEVYDLLGHKAGVYSLNRGLNTIHTNIKGICIVKACFGRQVVVAKLLLP